MSSIRVRPATGRSQALLLALIPMVALGLARFAFGSVLPAMRTELGWSYQLAALPTIANGIGYLVGAMTGARIAARFGPVNAASATLAITAASMAGIALSGDVWWVSAMRLIAGCTGAWAYVAGAVASTALHQRGVRMAMLWYPAGTGLGVAASALVGLWVRDRSELWDQTWLVFGLAGLVIAPLLRWFVADDDELVPPLTVAPWGGFGLVGWTIPVSYGLFGAGYICVATFGVSYLADRGASPVAQQAFWVVVGVAIMFSGRAWAPCFRRVTGGLPLALPVAGCAIGAGLLLLPASAGATLLAATALGSSLLNTTAGISTLIHRRLPPHEWGRAFAAITAAFAIGQMIGPVAALAVGEDPNGLGPLILLSTGLLAAGALVAAAPSPGAASVTS